jgi:SAM-dependent methyltransferase
VRALVLNIYEHLICPDCQGKLEMREQLTCESCGRIFLSNGRFLNLLPTNLSKIDLAEERFWETDRRQGLKAHPIISLIVSRDPIFYFYEQILPKLDLNGRILEIGSGTCWLSSFVKSAFPETCVIATDVAPTALVKGSQISDFLGSAIDCFVACKVEHLPFENDFFDYVIGSSILHHTCPRKSIHQIFRVLKNNGKYVGFGELAIPRVLGFLWGEFGVAGRREKELGVKEGEYTFTQWKTFFDEAGFQEARFDLDKDPEYKQHWFIHLYYKFVSRMPDSLIKRCLASSIVINASK